MATSPARSPSPGRPPTLTHAHEGDLVVFHIGMTIRKPYRPDLWGPVFLAMPAMLAELEKNRAAHERGEAEDLGFLGAYTLIGASGPWVVQYWKSTEQLYTYAAMPDRAHLPAWRRFHQTARKHPGAVGIWHETYAVPAGGIETLYGSGGLVGLGKATGPVPVRRRGRAARERLGSSLGRTRTARARGGRGGRSGAQAGRVARAGGRAGAGGGRPGGRGPAGRGQGVGGVRGRGLGGRGARAFGRAGGSGVGAGRAGEPGARACGPAGRGVQACGAFGGGGRARGRPALTP